MFKYNSASCIQSLGIFIKVKIFLPNSHNKIDTISPNIPLMIIPRAYSCSILFVLPEPKNWEHNIVTDNDITEKAIINRSMILAAFVMALAPVLETLLTIILSTFDTSSCSTSSIKIGQVYLSSFLSNVFILKLVYYGHLKIQDIFSMKVVTFFNASSNFPKG